MLSSAAGYYEPWLKAGGVGGAGGRRVNGGWATEVISHPSSVIGWYDTGPPSQTDDR
jgi:hypothetical protein